MYFQGCILCICKEIRKFYEGGGTPQDLKENICISKEASFGSVWKHAYSTRDAFRIYVNIRIFLAGYVLDFVWKSFISKGYAFDLYRYAYFTREQSWDLHENTCISKEVFFGFVWK